MSEEDARFKRLIVKTEIKRIIKEMGLQMSRDFSDALSQEVERIVRCAGIRATENKRKQVRVHDI